MTKDEALKLALGWLEGYPKETRTGVISAIREALAEQPAQARELARIPVLVERIKHEKAKAQEYFTLYNRACETAQLRLKEVARLESRLAAQQQEPNWSGSETMPLELWKNPAYSLQWRLQMADGAVAYERKVIANLRSQMAQQQEPVAWGVDWGHHGDRSCVSIVKKHPDGTIEVVATEYDTKASLRQRKPWVGLTKDDFIEAMCADGCERIECFYAAGPVQKAAILSFADAIEAKLKEKNNGNQSLHHLLQVWHKVDLRRQQRTTRLVGAALEQGARN